MKKIIFGLVLIITVAIAIGVYFVLNNLDALVKTAIETHGSEATQTAVRVEDVSISLTDGSGAINGLTIANPKGFSMPVAFSLGEVRTGIDLQSLQQEPYVISEIAVIAPQVFVEINDDHKTNLNELKKNLMSGMPVSNQPNNAETGQQSTSGQAGTNEPRLIIRRVIFSDGNIQARVAALDNKEYQIKLPSITMSNLGGNNGATASELANEIISRLTDRANEEVKTKIIDAKLDKLKAEARAKIEAEKARAKAKIEEEKTRLTQETDAKVEQQKDKAKDKLKGLFGK